MNSDYSSPLYLPPIPIAPHHPYQSPSQIYDLQFNFVTHLIRPYVWPLGENYPWDPREVTGRAFVMASFPWVLGNGTRSLYLQGKHFINSIPPPPRPLKYLVLCLKLALSNWLAEESSQPCSLLLTSKNTFTFLDVFFLHHLLTEFLLILQC